MKCFECGSEAKYRDKFGTLYCDECIFDQLNIKPIEVTRCEYCGDYCNPEFVYVHEDKAFCSAKRALLSLGCEAI